MSNEDFLRQFPDADTVREGTELRLTDAQREIIQHVFKCIETERTKGLYYLTLSSYDLPEEVHQFFTQKGFRLSKTSRVMQDRNETYKETTVIISWHSPKDNEC